VLPKRGTVALACTQPLGVSDQRIGVQIGIMFFFFRHVWTAAGAGMAWAEP